MKTEKPQDKCGHNESNRDMKTLRERLDEIDGDYQHDLSDDAFGVWIPAGVVAVIVILLGLLLTLIP